MKYLSQATKIAVYVEGELGRGKSKTAEGVLRYGKNPVVAVIDSTVAGRSIQEIVGIDSPAPIVASLKEALNFRPQALLLGTAKSGGQLPEEWREDILTALRNGLDIVSGLHHFLSEDEEIANVAKENNCQLYDVRRPPDSLPIADGRARTLKAFTLLTVGTDAAIGKKTVTLELCAEAEKRGEHAKFIATGQTGIMITGGEGIAIDRVIADFVAGAAEQMVLEAAKEHDLIFIEGQGALAHPGFSGVTLSLLHGACPKALILCHNMTRNGIGDRGDFALQSLTRSIEVYETMAALVSPTKVVGIALNTAKVSEAEAKKQIALCEEETGLPCNDAIRFGCKNLMDAILTYRETFFSCRPCEQTSAK